MSDSDELVIKNAMYLYYRQEQRAAVLAAVTAGCRGHLHDAADTIIGMLAAAHLDGVRDGAGFGIAGLARDMRDQQTREEATCGGRQATLPDL